MKKTRARELGITEFPYIERDENDYQIYWENSCGDWDKKRYDKNGNQVYYESSFGWWYGSKFDSEGEFIYGEGHENDKIYVIL